MALNQCELIKKLYDALGDLVENLECGCSCSSSEGIALPYGRHEVVVQLDNCPTEVFVSIVDFGLPVCQGDLSSSSVILQENGFLIYLDIKSNEAIVKWIVKHH